MSKENTKIKDKFEGLNSKCDLKANSASILYAKYRAENAFHLPQAWKLC